MNEIKITVPAYAEDDLNDFVTAAASRDEKRKFRAIMKRWKTSHVADKDDWVVTITPPANIVKIMEFSDTKSQHEQNSTER